MAVVRCFSLPFEAKSLSFPREAIKISESSQKISESSQKISDFFQKFSEIFLKLSEFFRTTLRLIEKNSLFHQSETLWTALSVSMEIANFALSATKDLGKSGQQLQKQPLVYPKVFSQTFHA